MHWLWTPLFPFEYFEEKKFLFAELVNHSKGALTPSTVLIKTYTYPLKTLRVKTTHLFSKLAWFWSSLDGNKFGDDDQWTDLLEHQSSEEGDSHWINTCRFDSCTHFCKFNPMGPVALSVFSFFVASIKRFSFFTHPLGGSISKTKLLNLRGSLEASKY